MAAADAEAAEHIARSLLDHALPTVTFTEVAAVLDTKDRVHRYPGHCSFCGKPRNEVTKLVAFPGAAICDECVELAVEIIQEDVQPPKSGA